MKEGKLSGTAQRIVLAELNRISTGNQSVKELIRAFESTKPTMNKALDELETAGLVTREFGTGDHRRDKYLKWEHHGRALWDAALPLMETPVTMIRYAESVSGNPDFINSGESLLHERVHEFTSRARPCYAFKAASDKNNHKRITKRPMKKSTCRVEFWRYPPVLPGRDSIDNLSLYLALDSAHDPIARNFRDKLLDSFPWQS